MLIISCCPNTNDKGYSYGTSTSQNMSKSSEGNIFEREAEIRSRKKCSCMIQRVQWFHPALYIKVSLMDTLGMCFMVIFHHHLLCMIHFAIVQRNNI